MYTHCTTLYVVLDIGKNVHWLGAYAGFELQPVVEPLELRSDRSGFERVTAILDGLLACGLYDRVVLGHEPTGVYHENWARAFMERYASHLHGQASPAMDYRFVNPLLSKREREAQAKGRKRKTDRADLPAIAACLRDGKSQPAFLATDHGLRLYLWGRAYRHNQRERRRLTRLILSQMDRLWPGAVVNVKRFRKRHPNLEAPRPLARSKPLERKHIRAILGRCPNPHHFLALGESGILAFFRAHVGRCGPKTAHHAYQVVKNALLPPPEVATLLAEQLQADFTRYLILERDYLDLAEQAKHLVPGSPAAVLTTIPGVSALLAARYLAHLGHPQRFLTAAQVWSFAGFDPVTQESGDFRRVGHISRKGDPGLRDTLFLIGHHTARNVPAIGRIKQRAKARGMRDVAATLHAAHKANRICHHLLYHQVPFDPDRLRPGPEARTG
jgi:transposase